MREPEGEEGPPRDSCKFYYDERTRVVRLVPLVVHGRRDVDQPRPHEEAGEDELEKDVAAQHDAVIVDFDVPEEPHRDFVRRNAR